MNIKKDHYIEKGTTIVATLSKDKIIFAADARAEIIPGDFKSPRFYIDTVNKIKSIGNSFYAIAGATHFRNISIDNLIEKLYDPTLSLENNIHVIHNGIKKVMDDYFTTLTPAEISYFNEPNRLGVFTMILVGFENALPFGAIIQIRQLKNENGFYLKDEPIMSHTFTGSESGLLSGGSQMYINQYLNRGFNAATMTPQDLIYLISLEAAQSEHIGKNVNYVVVDPSKHSWGKNY